MRWFFPLIIFLSPLLASAQVVVDRTSIQYGELDEFSNRVVDLTFENMGPTPALLLRSSFPEDYTFRFSARTIAPDSTITLRVKANPRKKGNFRDEVEIWFASMDKPIALTFTGDVQGIDRSDDPACPTFREQPPGCCDGNEVLVETVHAMTGEPLGKSRVRLVEQGRLRETYQTDRRGALDLDVPIAYYLLIADKEGFVPADTALYLNRRTPRVVLALNPLPEIEREVLEAQETRPTTSLDKPYTRPEMTAEKRELPDVPDQPTEPDEKPVPSEPLIAEDDAFSEAAYRPNNIVLLVDVSASMNKRGRMDLLKASLYELTDILRAGDRMAMITYAVQPETVLGSTSGRNKADINREVQNLEAAGMTYGIRGFKAAYKELEDHWIEGGNNEVIVVSDGVFRVQDQERIEKLVAKAAEKGVTTSMVGIRSNPNMNERLTAMSTAGGGSFVPMTDYDQCQRVLIQEIKSKSRR